MLKIEGMFGLVVSAVLVRGGRVTLVRRAASESFLPGRWGIPGGRVHEGETLAAALDREIREETGLFVGPRRLVAAHQYDDSTGQVELPVVQLTYLALEPVGEHVCASDEVDRVVWASPEKPPMGVWIDRFTRLVLTAALGAWQGDWE